MNNLQQQGGRNVYVPPPQRRNQHLTELPEGASVQHYNPTQPPPNYCPNNVDNSGMRKSQGFADAHHQPQIPGDWNNPRGGAVMNPQQYRQQHAPPQMHHNASHPPAYGGPYSYAKSDRSIHVEHQWPNSQYTNWAQRHPQQKNSRWDSLNASDSGGRQGGQGARPLFVGQGALVQSGMGTSTVGMAANNSADDSGHTSNSSPPLIYTVQMLLEKADDYLAKPDSTGKIDTAQASEKAFQAVRLALSNFVKRLEEKSKIEIVPKDASWNYYLYGCLTRLLRKKHHRKHNEKIQLGWAHGVILHKVGWCQNNLSIVDVKDMLPNVKKFVTFVEKLDYRDDGMAQKMRQLFLDYYGDKNNENEELQNVMPPFNAVGPTGIKGI